MLCNNSLPWYGSDRYAWKEPLPCTCCCHTCELPILLLPYIQRTPRSNGRKNVASALQRPLLLQLKCLHRPRSHALFSKALSTRFWKFEKHSVRASRFPFFHSTYCLSVTHSVTCSFYGGSLLPPPSKKKMFLSLCFCELLQWHFTKPTLVTVYLFVCECGDQNE